MAKRRIPAYCLHKPTDQARVRINGQDHYLGTYGSPESRDRYDDLVAEWLAKQGDVSQFTLTVSDLCLLFTEWADGYYRKAGKPTGEARVIRIPVRSKNSADRKGL